MIEYAQLMLIFGPVIKCIITLTKSKFLGLIEFEI